MASKVRTPRLLSMALNQQPHTHTHPPHPQQMHDSGSRLFDGFEAERDIEKLESNLDERVQNLVEGYEKLVGLAADVPYGIQELAVDYKAKLLNDENIILSQLDKEELYQQSQQLDRLRSDLRMLEDERFNLDMKIKLAIDHPYAKSRGVNQNAKKPISSGNVYQKGSGRRGGVDAKGTQANESPKPSNNLFDPIPIPSYHNHNATASHANLLPNKDSRFSNNKENLHLHAESVRGRMVVPSVKVGIPDELRNIKSATLDLMPKKAHKKVKETEKPRLKSRIVPHKDERDKKTEQLLKGYKHDIKTIHNDLISNNQRLQKELEENKNMIKQLADEVHMQNTHPPLQQLVVKGEPEKKPPLRNNSDKLRKQQPIVEEVVIKDPNNGYKILTARTSSFHSKPTPPITTKPANVPKVKEDKNPCKAAVEMADDESLDTDYILVADDAGTRWVPHKVSTRKNDGVNTIPRMVLEANELGASIEFLKQRDNEGIIVIHGESKIKNTETKTAKEERVIEVLPCQSNNPLKSPVYNLQKIHSNVDQPHFVEYKIEPKARKYDDRGILTAPPLYSKVWINELQQEEVVKPQEEIVAKSSASISVANEAIQADISDHSTHKIYIESQNGNTALADKLFQLLNGMIASQHNQILSQNEALLKMFQNKNIERGIPSIDTSTVDQLSHVTDEIDTVNLPVTTTEQQPQVDENENPRFEAKDVVQETFQFDVRIQKWHTSFGKLLAQGWKFSGENDEKLHGNEQKSDVPEPTVDASTTLLKKSIHDEYNPSKDGTSDKSILNRFASKRHAGPLLTGAIRKASQERFNRQRTMETFPKEPENSQNDAKDQIMVALSELLSGRGYRNVYATYTDHSESQTYQGKRRKTRSKHRRIPRFNSYGSNVRSRSEPPYNKNYNYNCDVNSDSSVDFFSGDHERWEFAQRNVINGGIQVSRPEQKLKDIALIEDRKLKEILRKDHDESKLERDKIRKQMQDSSDSSVDLLDRTHHDLPPGLRKFARHKDILRASTDCRKFILNEDVDENNADSILTDVNDMYKSRQYHHNEYWYTGEPTGDSDVYDLPVPLVSNMLDQHCTIEESRRPVATTVLGNAARIESNEMMPVYSRPKKHKFPHVKPYAVQSDDEISYHHHDNDKSDSFLTVFSESTSEEENFKYHQKHSKRPTQVKYKYVDSDEGDVIPLYTNDHRKFMDADETAKVRPQKASNVIVVNPSPGEDQLNNSQNSSDGSLVEFIKKTKLGNLKAAGGILSDSSQSQEPHVTGNAKDCYESSSEEEEGDDSCVNDDGQSTSEGEQSQDHKYVMQTDSSWESSIEMKKPKRLQLNKNGYDSSNGSINNSEEDFDDLEVQNMLSGKSNVNVKLNRNQHLG